MFKMMQNLPSLPILLGSAALLFGLNASAQVYSESTRQLTLPRVQVGAVAFPNVVIRLDNFTVLAASAPVSTPPTGSTAQSYSESSRQLAIGRVQVGNIWYSNVVLRLNNFTVLAAGAPVSSPTPPLGNVYETIDWGLLTVTEWGADRFAASYTFAGGGQVNASRDGLKIDGVWSQGTSAQRCESQRGGSFFHGRMTFTFDPQLGAFTGLWGYCDSTPDRAWNGNLAAPSALGNVYETIDWGQLTVTEWGANRFAASYTFAGGGQVTASRDGLKIDGVWSQGTSAQRCESQRGGSFFHGRMTFTFEPELGAFTGLWGYCDSTPDRAWNGSLLSRGAKSGKK